MRGDAVPAVWSEVETERRSFGWRLIDVAIAGRQALASIVPGRFRRDAGLWPATILVAVLGAGLLALAWRSLHTFDDFLATEGGLSLDQYGTVLGDEQFRKVLLRTVAMAVVTPLIVLLVAVPYTMTMVRTRSRWLRRLLLIGMFVPVLTGDITRTYGLLVSLGGNGPLSWMTENLGLGDLRVLGTLWAVGLGIAQTLLPVAVVVLLPGVLRLDPELGMAASTMGASPRTVFLRVTLPQLRTALVAALATTFALSMAAFADPAILGRGLNDFVGNFLQSRYLGLGSPPQGGTIGVLLLLIVTAGSGLIVFLGTARRRARA